MNTTTHPPYTAGQSVEVFTSDFSQRHYPRVWIATTVSDVQARDGGMWDVTVVVNGARRVERVGKRGGNRNLRAA